MKYANSKEGVSLSLPSALADGQKDCKTNLALAKNYLQPMSHVKIWIHLVFATKYREHLINNVLNLTIHDHIMSNCKKKDIYLQAINGSTDHIHLLISLGKDQSVAHVVQLIKGESSFWINQKHILPNKFSWQDDYFAVSVSESLLGVVVNYIKNQEEHHKKKTFSEEVDEFLTKYGFMMIKDE
jgi:putative transposase